MRSMIPVLVLALVLSIPASARTLFVGPNQPLKTLQAGVRASSSGDVIVLTPGDYINDFATVRHALTITSHGQKARLLTKGLIPGGKAILVARADLTVQNLIFSSVRVRDKNGAGIRHEKGGLVVEDCVFEANENGILGGNDPSASVVIRGSHFANSGYGRGYTHGIYIGTIASLAVSNSTFTNTRAGHHIKSRARATTVSGSLFDDGDAGTSYAIDLPDGGTNLVRDNVFLQGARPGNSTIISIGTRSQHQPTSLLVENNVFYNFARQGTAVRNAMSEPVVLKANALHGPLALLKGPGTQEGNLHSKHAAPRATIVESWHKIRALSPGATN